MVIEPLQHRVYSKRGGLVNHNVSVDLTAHFPETIRTDLRSRERLVQLRFFRNSIEHTARSTPSEQERIWASKNFNLL